MSNVMGWLRRRFRFLGGVASAVSYADTGPYAGAPRDPELRIGDEKTYSTIRHETNHTTIAAAPWVPESQMPSARRARAAARKHVV